MVTMVTYPPPAGLLSQAGELTMPFSDAVKFSILGVSVLLLLLALAILAWQIFRCFSQTHTTCNQQDVVDGDLLYSHDKPATSGNYSGPPSLKVHGSLRFSVYFDRVQSRLVVCVLQVEGLQDHSRATSLQDHSRATSLQDHSRATSLQPFVKVRLLWAGSEAAEVESLRQGQAEATPLVLCTVLEEWHTRIVKGSCNPLFGDQFSCILPEDKDTLSHIDLRMEVRDFDKFSRHTVLGEVRIPLGNLNISYPLELQEDLQIPQKDLVGEVLLSLRFLPTSQRLEVGLLKVRLAVSETDSAMYARISIQCNQSKLRYQKTSAVPRCLVTVFNEVLMFSLPEFPLEQCKILVSLYETRTPKKSSKRLIGQLSVAKESSSEDEHWTLMLRSVRQPVAKWHGLLI
ncbi:synaptotagmin-2 isoform X2 [Cololabis saira]|uniref:synaptotagmin-2 isoform X2 n=1 Tax=Cololabis saira TaxID=129043 RepID=UPI002AD29FF0|nr:synaptotagmin-2 isoform X2 [Cololabis saira]